MKKYIFPLLVFCCFWFCCFRAEEASGFDIAGFQPLAPNGVFSTFSASTLKKGKGAVSFGVERSVDPNYYRFSFHMAYGIKDNMELSMNLPYVDKLNSAQSGIEDISIGFRHRFFDEGGYGPSLAYIVTASLPTGRDEFSTEGRMGAGFVMSKRVGPVHGHINLFYIKAGTQRIKDNISFLAGLDFSASHNHKLLAEIYGRKGYSSDELELLEVRFGYRFMRGEDFYTTIGLGADLENRHPEYRVMLSATVLFPSEQKIIKNVYEE